MIEEKVNNDGQKQYINNLDVIVKIEDKFLQVRLIRTEKWKNRNNLTQPMPRAKFVDEPKAKGKLYYFVNREEIIKLKRKNEKEKENHNTCKN